ncbi:hypothetical protein C8J57DRAFT_1214931 [Mycena rebaudengoi]|nr:hypothetical protein C8J57DRAFT_1214931 [Mycena rebaudengoi]
MSRFGDSASSGSRVKIRKRQRRAYFFCSHIFGKYANQSRSYLGDVEEDIQNSAGRRHLPFWNVPRVGSKHTPTDREYLDSPSARQLMDLHDYVRGFRGMHPPTYSDAPSQLFFATYIARNASKFLDHEWVDIARVSRATTKFRIV